MFIANEVLTINKVNSIEGGNELIRQCGKLLKLENCQKAKNYLSQEI